MYLAIWTAAAILRSAYSAACATAQVEVRFALGSAALSKRSRETLEGISSIARSAAAADAAPPQIFMKSETDLTGDHRFNDYLAKRRGLAVQHYLERQGLRRIGYTIEIPYPAVAGGERRVPDPTRRRVILQLNPQCRPYLEHPRRASAATQK